MKVAGKVFAVTAFEPDDICMACKVTQEEFAEWTEREGVIQAPYFAKRQWIGVEKRHSLTQADVRRLVDRSYELVVAGLTKKAQAELAGGGAVSAVRVVGKAKPASKKAKAKGKAKKAVSKR